MKAINIRFGSEWMHVLVQAEEAEREAESYREIADEVIVVDAK